MKLRSLARLTAILAPALVAAVVMSACGQMKNRDDKVMVVHDQAAQVSPAQLSSSLDQIRQFIDLYFDGGAITRDGLQNLLLKYKGMLGKFLEGTKLSLDDLIDLLFKFDSNHDGKLSADEVAKGLSARIPILRWIPDNVAELTQDELAQKIAQEYPDANPASRDGLAHVLMAFDDAWADGNVNGKVSRHELAGPGLILGLLEGTDLTKPIRLPGFDQNQQLVVEQLKNKLNEQIFGHVKQIEYNHLPPIDIQLEFQQLAMRGYLTRTLVMHYAPQDGQLAPAQQTEALSQLGPEQQPHWSELRKLYDNPVMGGDNNGKLNAVESFNLITDLNYTHKLIGILSGDVSHRGLKATSWHNAILADLLVLLPRTGRSLFLTGDADEWRRDPWAARAAFWDGLKLYDTREYGGNADGKLDEGELAMALSYCRIVENIFALYDVDHDGEMTKPEARELFKTFGIHDNNIVDGFFADLGLDGHDVSFWEKFKAFFTGKTDIDRLSPWEFYVRMAKVLPRILSGAPLGGGNHRQGG